MKHAIIDTHAHLCDPVFDGDREPVLKRARSAAKSAVELLLACGAKRVQLHAFDGKAGSAMPAVEAGYFFSVPPAIARSRQKQKLVRARMFGWNFDNIKQWLALEKQFMRDVIENGKPLLGICLGAQLVASAMGARVYRNTVKEIGWFPKQGAPTTGSSDFSFPSSMEVFHWHGETYDLPAGATLLARSEACENQAFQIGRSVIGLQFHLETTPESARDIVFNCRDELAPAQYVQTQEEILSARPETYESINRMMRNILSFLQEGHG